MSRLFYHVMQDNAGNLLFDVSGTMRLAGSGTLATIYGDEALTVILPNPMTNHPSFGSFKCFLGAGDYDFYMAKAGYTFETLTGVQGHGTMAQQDASAVAVTGGTATLATLTVTQTTPRGSLEAKGGITVANYTPSTNDPYALFGNISAGTGRYNLFMNGTALNFFNGHVLVGRASEVPGVPSRLLLSYLHGSIHGLTIIPSDADTGSGQAAVFCNLAGTTVGTIAVTATTTAYNTASDVRLKHAVAPLTGALDVVRRLNPITHLWNADGSRGYGFLAHELQVEIPDAVSGQPDEVNEDGSIKPQQVDHSRLVPWLTAALQEAVAQVQALTARVASLEEQLGV